VSVPLVGPAKAAGAALDLGDQMMRVASALALYEKFTNNPAKYLPGVEAENVSEAAMRLVSRRINEHFQNLPFQKKQVRQLSQHAGVIGPFIGTVVDEFRIRGNAIESLMTNADPEMKWRMLQAGMIMLGAWGVRNGYNQLTGNGVSEEGIEAAMANRSQYNQAVKPVVVVSHKDDKGQYVIHDLTRMHPFLQLLRGHPNNPWWSNVLVNIAKTPFAEPVQTGIDNLAGTMGYQPAVEDPRYKDAKVGVMSTIKWGAGAGAIPKVYGSSMDALRGLGYVGHRYPGEDPMTPLEGGLRALNIPIPEHVNPGGERIVKGLEKRAAEKEIRSGLRETKKNPDMNRDAVRERLRQERETIRKRQEAVEKYQQSKK
jgi:hypothetical protein